MEALAELWSFMRLRKKFWLAPILLTLLLLGLVAVMGEGTVVAPPSSTRCFRWRGCIWSPAGQASSVREIC